MTMCDRYDMEHPDAESTKMTKHFDNQTLPVDTNEQPACLSKVYRAVDDSQYTSNGEAGIVHPSWSVAEKHEQGTLKWTPAEDGGHSILEKRTHPIELVPGESEYNEDELHPWDDPFLTEAEKQFYVMTPESARKRKEWKKKMNEMKHYYMGDIDPYINGIPKGLKQKQEYDIGERAMKISEAEREKEMGIRDFLTGCKEEMLNPSDEEEFAKELEKEYGLEKVRLRNETDPRMPAWERRKYVEDEKKEDKAVLKEYLTEIIEKTLNHAMERQCMWCQIPSIIATDYPEDMLKVIPTHKDRDAVLNELFEEYRELGYRVDLLGSTFITPKKARYGWMDGVAFIWGDEEDYEKSMSNVMEIDLPDDDDSPVMSEETIQWLDIEQIQPPKKMELYLVLRKDVDTGEEKIETCWWDRRYCPTEGDIDVEWDFGNTCDYMKVIAWSNLPLRKRKGE